MHLISIFCTFAVTLVNLSVPDIAGTWALPFKKSNDVIVISRLSPTNNNVYKAKALWIMKDKLRPPTLIPLNGEVIAYQGKRVALKFESKKFSMKEKCYFKVSFTAIGVLSRNIYQSFTSVETILRCKGKPPVSHGGSVVDKWRRIWTKTHI